MRTTVRAALAAAGLVAVVGTAIAADMTGDEIKAFTSGNTVYIETTPASVTGTPGQGVIYWAEDGTALYKTPTGALWHGKREIKGNTNCTDWKEKQPLVHARAGTRPVTRLQSSTLSAASSAPRS